MIDWKFIGSLEGQSILTGYVPNPSRSNSGVTIATGVDLGQIATPPPSAALAAKIAPYVGLCRWAAVNALNAVPLVITQAESDELDRWAQGPDLAGVRSRYGAADFDAMPDAAQTVIASLAFQYGPNLAAHCPKFWRAALSQDWPDVVAELRNFGDDYPTRRGKEADYLEVGA